METKGCENFCTDLYLIDSGNQKASASLHSLTTSESQVFWSLCVQETCIIGNRFKSLTDVFVFECR